MNSLGRITVKPLLRNLAFKQGKTVGATAARSFSTMFDQKEHAEETRFIREMEKRRHEEIAAKVQSIMSQSDESIEKQELLSLLEKKEAKGFVEKYGLNDWKVAVPLGIIFGIPVLHNEIYVISEETMFVGVFMLFLSTLYTQLGPVISKHVQAEGDKVLQNLQNDDLAIRNKLKEVIKSDQEVLTIDKDFKEFYQFTDDLATVEAQVLNQIEEHKYRSAIVKKLESLKALEDSAVASLKRRMVTTVRSDVLNTFQNDKKAKEAALNQAIAVLSGGANAKLGKDVVGEVFTQSLANYRASFSKKNEENDEVMVQLRKDIEGILKPPAVEAEGGNVLSLQK